jgi:CheY-like chemotaxis protein
MPIVNGIASTERIRNLEKTYTDDRSSVVKSYGRTPIFAVSATLKPHDLPKFLRSGFDGWILKPVHFGRLNDILLGAFSAEARKDCLYNPENFAIGGWFQTAVNP